LADVTSILAHAEISIDAMLQKEPVETEQETDIVILTHPTKEQNMDKVIAQIEALATVRGKIIKIRSEVLA
jgi:homoserine dehydrogenase